MSRPTVAVLLVLALLLQGLAPARALTPAINDTEVAEVVVDPSPTMPCHGAQTATLEVTPAAPASMPCCDAGVDCGHCSAGCMAAPALLGALPSAEAPSPRIVATIASARTPAAAPPTDRLRPPIPAFR